MECQRCGFDNVQRDICSQCNASLGPGDDEVWRLRRALEKIDAIAVMKKAGAAKRMQEIAREALALSNGNQ